MGKEPKMAIRVHLADDHTRFREGLESILASRAEGIEVVGQSSSGEKMPWPSSRRTSQTWSSPR
jgi:DNA-binding NarL/FixJ family response regulator